ncbi:ABCC4, partial [Symbiodinium sp. CCMP2456]
LQHRLDGWRPLRWRAQPQLARGSGRALANLWPRWVWQDSSLGRPCGHATGRIRRLSARWPQHSLRGTATLVAEWQSPGERALRAARNAREAAANARVLRLDP